MPAALAAIVVSAIGVGGVVATALTIGLTIGINALIGAVFKPARAKPSDGQQVTRQAIGSRRRHYGIVHTGGQLTFFDSAGGTLAQVVTLGTGEEAEILEHRINDKVVTVVGSTVSDASFHGAVQILTRPGSASQSAIGEVTALFPAWTASHRQRGCAHAAILAGPVKQELFSEVYGGQMPQYSQVRKAAKVYNPLKDSTALIYDDGAGFTVFGTGPQRLADPSTWAWDDLASLVIADYAAHADGYGLGYDAINWLNVAGETQIAAELVDTASGETIERWRLWASYSLASDERRDVLADMCKAADAFVWQDAAGLFNLKLGRWEAPAVTLRDDHFLSMSARIGPDAQSRVSAIKVLYTEATIGYREQESATIGDGAEDPNTDPQAINAFYAPHHNQAARVGKLAWKRLGDRRWHVTGQLNLFGLNLLGERFCRLESAELGIAAWFAVDAIRLNLSKMSVEVTLNEVDPADWDFDPLTEEGTPPGSAAVSGVIGAVETPGGLVLTAVQIKLGETSAVAIEPSWDPTGRIDLWFEVRYRPSAGGSWVMMTVDQDALTARSGPVDSSTEYEVQVRAITRTKRASNWSASGTITPVAAALLSPPSELTAIGSEAQADITLRLPTEPSLAYARLYRTSGTSFTSPVTVGGDIVGALGEVIARTDAGLSPGTKYYWAQAFNALDEPSALAGPEAAVVT